MESDLDDVVSQAARKAWQYVLGIDNVAADDDFYEFGGHSLSAIRVVSMMGQEIERKIEVKMLLKNPEFSDFVREVIQQIKCEADKPNPTI